MPVAREKQEITIKKLDLQTVNVQIEGDTELIVHAWSDKAKKMILDKQMGKTKVRRELKDPEQDYKDSMYFTPEGYPAFPASGFKAAIVGACRMFSGLPMTVAKIAIRVNGDLVPIVGAPRMREDMVRLETGVADIRFRAGFPKWSATIPITFNADVISMDQLINLVDAAGFGGVGEWRPSAPKSASGSFGCFHVIKVGG